MHLRARTLASVVGLSITATACGSRPAVTRTPEPGRTQPSGWGAPPAPPSWAATAASMGMSASAFLESLPCPPPGLPPAVARLVDCAVVHKVAGAARYVPVSVAAGSLPREVDLRIAHLMGPVKNQQQVGACAGFALSSILDNAARRMGRGDVIAPLHVFATYGPSDKGLGALRGVPLTLEPVWPYDPRRACAYASSTDGCGNYYGVAQGEAGPGVAGEKARADASGRYRIDAFEEMDPVDPTQIAILNAAGEAVWIAMDIGGWSDPHDGVVSDWSSSTPSAHALVVSGYRHGPREREFLLQNSWGPEWGAGGSAWIEESTLARHATYAYHLRISDASMPALPAPSNNVPSVAWPALPTCASDAIATPLGCIGLGSASLPGIPAAWPATPPTLASCRVGSLPNPFTGGCVTL